MNDDDRRQHTTDGPDLVEQLVRRAGPRPRAPEETANRVRNTVESEWLRMVGRRGRKPVRTWGVVAALAASILLAVVAVRTLRDSRSTAVEGMTVAQVEIVRGDARFVPAIEELGRGIGRGTRIETGADGRVALRMAEGQSLRIDVQTSVSLESSRTVRLERGQIYVDSGIEGPHSDQGMTIRTRLGEACEVGTQYAVALDASRMRVRVREGLVEVRHDAGSATAVGGVEVDVGPGGEMERRSILPHAGEWDWVGSVAPPPDIDGLALDEFLTWVSRETGRTVVFRDALLAGESKGIALSGTVEGLEPTEALRAVLPTCGLAHVLEDGRFVIDSEPDDRSEG